MLQDSQCRINMSDIVFPVWMKSWLSASVRTMRKQVFISNKPQLIAGWGTVCTH